MTKVSIDPGICGFPIFIHASSEDMQNVKITMATGCPNLKEAAKELKEFDAFKEIFNKDPGKSEVYTLLSKYVPHPVCPVFCGVLKAIEAEAGLALPKDCSLRLRKSKFAELR